MALDPILTLLDLVDLDPMVALFNQVMELDSVMEQILDQLFKILESPWEGDLIEQLAPQFMSNSVALSMRNNVLQ